jgi:formylglycine-generating enzyme required for sulfatase activity
MAGNVSEWVNDWYGEIYYQDCVDHGIVNDPPGPATGTFRILRSGDFRFSQVYLRVAYRISSISHLPSYQREYIEFRCARGGAYGP